MLKHRIEMYIPMNTPEQGKVMDEVFYKFCKWFGGATVNPVVGGWVDPKGTLIKDKIGIIHSFVEKADLKTEQKLKKLALNVRDQLGKDCILLVLDGNAEFY